MRLLEAEAVSSSRLVEKPLYEVEDADVSSVVAVAVPIAPEVDSSKLTVGTTLGESVSLLRISVEVSSGKEVGVD